MGGFLLSDNKGDQKVEVYECPICGSEVPGNVDRCPGCGAVFDTSRLQCPICGEDIASNAEECPKCGTLFGEGPPEADLDLFADLTCPVCDTPLDEDDTICPGCGQEIEITDMEEDEEDAFPVSLTSSFSLWAQEGMVNGSGMTNGAGMVNGRGMVNGHGLTNGAGMVNGGGFINGRGGKKTSADLSAREGLVNGRGIYDLDEGERLLSTRMIIPPRRHRTKPLAMTLVLVMVLVLVGAMMIMVPSSKEAITIDGELSDWSGVRRFSDRTGDVTNANLDIDSYAIKEDGDDLAILVQVTGRMLDGNTPRNGVDTLLIMFDVDGDDVTGFRFNGMGIDYRVEVRGWDNEVNGASMDEFKSSRDPRDWNGFVSIGSVSAKSRGDSVEIKATGAANWMANDDAVFAVTLSSADLDGDWTPFTGSRPGAVEARQTVLGEEGTYLMPGEQYAILQVDVTARDVEARVDYITVVSALEPAPTLLDLLNCVLFLDSNRNGNWDSGDLQLGTDKWGTGDDGGVSFNMKDSPVLVPQGTVQRLFLVATVGGSAYQGRVVKLAVPDPWSMEAGDLPVTVLPPEGMAHYIGGFSLPVTIDGLFEDWESVFLDENVTLHEDEAGDGPRSSLDLFGYASFIDPRPGADRALFYASIDPSSQVLRGTPIPLSQLERPGGGGGGGGGGPGPSEPPELYGDDAVQFFIRVDGAGEGFPVHGIRATHVLDVRGVGGRVTSSSLWEYTGDAQDPWERTSDVVLAAAGGTEVEASLETTNLGTPEVAVVLVRGWDGPYDFGAPGVVDDPGSETRTGNGPWDDPVPIPEFGDLLAPVSATLVAYALVRRRRRR